MEDSQKLLADYVKQSSEAAFQELVSRYINLVYSTALRLVNGDAHLAEDVTQTVFVDLARKARTLPAGVMLGGWLHRDTCFVAGTTMRGERRRHLRERQAIAMNGPEDHTAANLALVAPVLDDAINQLEPDDRSAILLRFFEQLEFRAVGERTGSNEDAARMRVNRALEKLHTLLKNRGVAFSAAALGAALTAGVITAAPLGLVATVARTALASVAAGGVTAHLLKFVTITKIKIAVAGALAVLAVAIVVQHQSLSKLRQEDQALKQQAARLALLQAENQRLSHLAAQAGPSPVATEKQVHELARLRAEVANLREKTNAMATVRERIHQVNGNQESREFGGTLIPRMTMKAFASLIGQVLQVPVADQTGLIGGYRIKMSNLRPRIIEGRVERVARILFDELGLQLVPFNGGFAIKLDHLDAPGLTPGTVESASNAQPLAAGTYEADSPGLPPVIANKLRMIESTKGQWTLEFRKRDTDIPTWQDLRLYLGSGSNGDMSAFTNSSDGEYIIGAINQIPQFRAGARTPGNAESKPAPEPGYTVEMVNTRTLDSAARSILNQNLCITSLRLIDFAKRQWALQNEKQSIDAPTMEDLRPYFARRLNRESPVCPDGGVYTIGSINEKPKCSIPGHVLP